jgi:DnaJ family protein B protein 6
VLFNSLFGDTYHDHFPHFNDRGRHSRHDRFNADPFSSMGFPSGFGSMPNEGFGVSYGGNAHPRMRSSSFQSSFVNNGQNPCWVSESRVTRSINGVTESVHERRDLDGNTHVTVKHPDGRITYSVNGMEQPSAAPIVPPLDNHHHPYANNHRSSANYQHRPDPYYADPDTSGQRWGW